jgi:hypothetical protein
MAEPMWLVDFRGVLSDSARGGLSAAGITLDARTGSGTVAPGGAIHDAGHHWVLVSASDGTRAIEAARGALKLYGPFSGFEARPFE